MTVLSKFQAVYEDMNLCSIEREDVNRIMVIAPVARVHVFMIGPPGVAKSHVVSQLVKRIKGARKFELLMTRFTGPEEVFGPPSIAGLQQGRFERVSAGMLQEAEFGFCDEVDCAT